MQGPDIGPAISILMLLFFSFVVLLICLLGTVIPFWKICTKAGFPGALSLLMLVPLGNIILFFYLAFAEWPALRQTQPDQYNRP